MKKIDKIAIDLVMAFSTCILYAMIPGNIVEKWNACGNTEMVGMVMTNTLAIRNT